MRHLFLLYCLTVSLLFYPALAASTTADRLPQLQQEIETLQNKLAQSRNKQKLLRQELTQTEQNIGHIATELHNTEYELTTQNQILHQLNQQMTAQEQALAQQQTHLTQQLTAMHRLGKNSQIKLFLNQEDPATINRLLTYNQHIYALHSQLISEMRTTLATIAEQQATINIHTVQLQKLQQQQQQQHQELANNQEYRQQILTEVEQQIVDDNQQLNALLAEQQQLEKLVKRLDQRSRPPEQSIQPFTELRQQLPLPTTGTLITDYGQQIKQSNMDYHGIFIEAAAGTEVHAVHAGQVVFADWLNGFGFLIIVDHGEGYMTLYAHNRNLKQHKGNQVNAGDVLATVGNSGGNQKNGLYFEIRHHGNPKDPNQWFIS